jgi:hypothetical protein
VAELRERIPVQIQVTQSDRTAASTIKVVPWLALFACHKINTWENQDYCSSL